MITFERLWKTMNEKGVSTNTLREKCGIDRKTKKTSLAARFFIISYF